MVKEKNISLHIFYQIKDYKYILAHSAGSTLLFYTLSFYKVTGKHIVSFDGHILHKKINTTPAKAIRATLNNMKPSILKSKIIHFTQSTILKIHYFKIG